MCQTIRYGGHHVGEPGTAYRTKDEMAAWRERDAIICFEEKLLDKQVLTSQDVEAMRDEIDRRVRYLSKRLESLKVVEQRPTDCTAIFFSAWFEIEDESGETQRLRIVGPDETDATLGWISIDSPLARAALKKRIDDEFEAELPGGRRRFAVVAVYYEEPTEE